MSTPTTTGLLAPGLWLLDATASTASFTAHELGLITVRGTFPLVEGWVDVDEHGVPVAAAGSLDPAGVQSGNARRDADLRSKRFLDVEAWPLIRFSADDIRPAGPSGSDGWTMAGTLEVKGHHVPLAWSVTAGERIEASVELDREAAGIRVPRWLIQRAVQVRLSAAFTPPAP